MADFSFVGQPAKRCQGTKKNPGCGNVWPLAFFRFHRARGNKCTCYTCDHPEHHFSRCIDCELTGRTKQNEVNPFLVKLRRTCTRHAQQDGYESLKAWEYATGLDVTALAEDAEHEFAHGRCYHCRRLWTSMPNGRADMTLERIDPTQNLTRSNFRWMCATGNRDKQRTPPHKWDQKQRCWELADECRAAASRPEQLALFGGAQ